MMKKYFSLVLACLMILAMFATPVLASEGENSEVESVETPPASTESEIVNICDKTHTFSENEIAELNSYAEKMSRQRVYFYIEEIPDATAQDATRIASEKYREVFGNVFEYGVVITFIYTIDEVHVGYSVKQSSGITQTKAILIVKECQKSTTSNHEWIIASYKAIVDSIVSIERAVNGATSKSEVQQQAVDSKSDIYYLKVICGLLLTAMVLLTVITVWLFIKVIVQKKKITNKEYEYSKLSNRMAEQSNKISNYETELERLKNFVKNTHALYPNIDREIEEHMVNEGAKKFDSQIIVAVKGISAKEDYVRVTNLLEMYRKLSDKEKTFVTADVERYEALLVGDLAKCYAREIEGDITSVIKMNGTMENLSRFSKILNEYDSLPNAVATLVSGELVERLKEKYERACADLKRNEYKHYIESFGRKLG